MKTSLIALLIATSASFAATAATTTDFFDSAFTMPDANPALVVGGWCKHYVKADGYHEDGVFQEFTENNNAYGFELYNVSLVKFTNSYAKSGTALFYTFEPDFAQTEFVDFGLRVGATLGYGDTPVGMDVAPYIAPVAEFKPFAASGVDYLDSVHFEVAAQIIPTEGVVMMLNAKIQF